MAARSFCSRCCWPGWWGRVAEVRTGSALFRRPVRVASRPLVALLRDIRRWRPNSDRRSVFPDRDCAARWPSIRASLRREDTRRCPRRINAEVSVSYGGLEKGGEMGCHFGSFGTHDDPLAACWWPQIVLSRVESVPGDVRRAVRMAVFGLGVGVWPTASGVGMCAGLGLSA